MSILDYQNLIRISAFLSIFIVMALLELVIPKRPLSIKKSSRWFNNISIVILNSVILKIIFPTAAVGIALWANEHKLGLLYFLNLPSYSSIILSIIFLDFVIYLQHVLFHALPIFWRFHRVHHIDQDIDVTTGLRFHPGEIILSLLIKFSAIVLIGTPAISVLLFEVILNATAMFNHSNIHLNKIIDRLLRAIIVTPDMHRVHHSTIPYETNSNYGFNLSIWDRLFGTYRSQPKKGHQQMQIGLADYRNTKQTQRILSMLWFPFIK
ncbi:sterol desaturase family protein [Thiotrichales bacterium 19S3-7]|nr:sterol desaturase family protein [Thiotrichales bacterium 19S3-7]MCF6800852.1 sterol desaturase family protein [Thiotrichales bacterium 19S3-11]